MRNRWSLCPTDHRNIVDEVTVPRGEAKMQALLEAAPDVVVGVDQPGVSQFSRRQESLFGSVAVGFDRRVA